MTIPPPAAGSPLHPWAREVAAREMASAPERRRRHGAGVDEIAALVVAILPAEERDFFLATAALHDIGFSAGAHDSGYWPLDGGRRLEALGAPRRMAALIANNVGGGVEAELRGLGAAYDDWPDEATPLRDALWFSCITTAADGSPIEVDDRIAAWPAQYPEPVILEAIARIREPLRDAVARTAARLDEIGLETPGRTPASPPGQRNFRDLGGLPTGDGRVVGRGVVYRSGDLSDLTESSRRRLADAEIATVVDLRADEERAAVPSDWGAGAEPRTIGVGGDLTQHLGELFEDVVDDPSGAAAERMMLANYGRMPTFLAPAVRELAGALLDDDGPPVLVHCTAGKDRTGVVCAILLAALGVEREAILADYLRSSRFYGRREIAGYIRAVGAAPAGAKIAPAVLDAFVSRGEYLDAAFAAIDEGHGSLDGYLGAVVGLDRARLARLRERLLEPASADGQTPTSDGSSDGSSA